MYNNFDSYDFYKGLTRNPEIGNTPVQVLPNIWRLGELEIPNLARMFVIKCYSTLQNTTVIASTVSEVLRENQLGGGGKITQKLAPPTFTQIQVKHASEKSRKIPLVNIVAEEDVLKYY